jgi:hypothetical protein
MIESRIGFTTQIRRWRVGRHAVFTSRSTGIATGMESEQDPSGGHDDPRAGDPPAGGDEEHGGPQGNPEVDEEALEQRQQEGGADSGN